MAITIAHSVLDAGSVAPLVAARWKLRIESIGLHSARVHDTYRIQHASGTAALRIAAADDAEAMRREYAVARHIASCGGPIATPHPEVIELAAPEGTRIGMLSEWVDGARLDEERSEDSCHALGVALARLHALPSAPELPPWSPLDGLDDLPHRLAALGPAYRETVDLTSAAIEALPALDAPTHRCGLHGDLDSTNGFVTRQGAILIDLDAAVCGPPVYDAACFLGQLFAWPWPRHAACAAAFLDGLAPADCSQMPAMIALRLLWVLRRHLDQAARHGTAHITPRFARHLARDATRIMIAPPEWITRGPTLRAHDD